MVFFNHATRQMTTKIVYYGPGLCGKTTNLNTIYARTAQKARGEMVSLNTETDRTLFFDLLPMDVGMVGGFKTKLQLYTVPGQVFYNSTRKLVLKGVDGIVFVADSQLPLLDANKESLQNLKDNLRELGLDLHAIPRVFQWNKRDLKNIVPVEILERELNPGGLASFQSIAQDGTGVFETLRGITRLALSHIKALHLAEAAATPATGPRDTHPSTPPAPLQAEDLGMPSTRPPSGDAPVALTTADLGGPVLPAPPAAPAPRPAHPLSQAAPSAPRPAPVQVMAPIHVKVSAPATGAPRAPKVTVKPLGIPAAVPRPHLLPTAPVAVPKPALLRPHADLRIALTPLAQDGELEVQLIVRQGGTEVGAGTWTHAAPGWGASALFSVELKRS
jgi:mutual gliding-motility protein MglA